MVICYAADEREIAARAAQIVIEGLRAKPEMLFCAAAGASPIATYQRLAEGRTEFPELFERMRVLQLDEWGGLATGDARSCEVFLRRHLLEPLGIGEDRYVSLQSGAPEPADECRRISAWLRHNGPIDVCLLGLGLNGHIALNEPSERLAPFAHVADLAPETSDHPMLRGLGKPPGFGLTLGMAEILAARKIVLVVSGRHKRGPFQRLCHPEISTTFPASFLWLHPDVLCLCDPAASGEDDQ